MIEALDSGEIQALLSRETTGRIGCHSEGRTYVVPITYVYEDGSVYGHSREGLKIRMMRANPDVCFEVDRVESPSRWRSVIARGRYEELWGGRAVSAMDLWIRRFEGLDVGESGHPSYLLRRGAGEPTAADGTEVILFRIVLGETTGRRENA